MARTSFLPSRRGRAGTPDREAAHQMIFGRASLVPRVRSLAESQRRRLSCPDFCPLSKILLYIPWGGGIMENGPICGSWSVFSF